MRGKEHSCSKEIPQISSRRKLDGWTPHGTEFCENKDRIRIKKYFHYIRLCWFWRRVKVGWAINVFSRRSLESNLKGKAHIRPKLWRVPKVLACSEKWSILAFGVRAQEFRMQHVPAMSPNRFLTRATVWKIIVCCFWLTLAKSAAWLFAHIKTLLLWVMFNICVCRNIMMICLEEKSWDNGAWVVEGDGHEDCNCGNSPTFAYTEPGLGWLGAPLAARLPGTDQGKAPKSTESPSLRATKTKNPPLAWPLKTQCFVMLCKVL